MRSLSLIFNACATGSKLEFLRTMGYYLFRNFSLSSSSLAVDVCLMFEDSDSADDTPFLRAKFFPSEIRVQGQQDELSFGEKYMAKAVDKNLLLLNNKEVENGEITRIKRILTNRGWNLTSSNGFRIELNEDTIIRIINDLYEEASDAALAFSFFKWSEFYIGSKHTIKSVCRMIHILASGNMNHRVMDLMLQLARTHIEEDSCSLLLKVLCETHTERRFLETTCSMLVNCYIKENKVNTALKLTCQMEELNIFPSARVCNGLLRELIGSEQLDLAWEWLEIIWRRGMGLNAACISLFIQKYCTQGNPESGWKLLLEMKNYGVQPDVVSFTIIINTLCKMSCLIEATSLLFKMTQLDILPDPVLISAVIDGHCKLGHTEEAISLLKFFNRPLNIFMYNSFISKLCSDGNMVKASSLFHEMTEVGLLPDCFSYTTIIQGYCKVGDLKKAYQYLGTMIKGGTKPSVITYTALVDSCCKSGNMKMAECLFQKLITEGLLPDVVVYNTLMNGYGKKGNLQKVFELLDIMKSSDVHPDVVTYNTLIHSLVLRGFVNEAEDIMEELTQRGFSPDVMTFTNLIDGFSKKGNFEEAYMVWFYMSEQHVKPDVVTLSALLNGYCRQRHMEKANLLFRKMLGIGLKPDLRLYNILVHGFCSVGDLDEACNIVCMMVENAILPNNITHKALVLGFEKKWAKNPEESAAFKLQETLLRYGVHVDVDEYLIMIEQPGCKEAT
ncbi:hypothetical protein UlMin_024971 [Ulmus minor]